MEQHISRTVVINCPLEAVFERWMRFEEYSQFMPGVVGVTQIDRTRLRWRTGPPGREREWDAAITKLEPGKSIVWQSVSGPRISGHVSFNVANGCQTLLRFEVRFEPKGGGLNNADVNVVNEFAVRVQSAIDRFKRLIEGNGCDVPGGNNGLTAFPCG
jgi:uncharacterized membrane protein